MTEREKVIKGLECCTKGEVCFSDCPYFKEVPMADGKCITALQADALALLREQEPKTGHWIFESRYCDAWSNICSECGRLMTTGAGVYANYCSNCGAKMTGGEEK